MGPTEQGRIPWRSVVEWCAFHGGDVEFLDGMFGVMDGIYLEYYARSVKSA